MRRNRGDALIRILACALPLLFLSSCAGVKFYSDPELKKPAALPLYSAKPYLLVTPGGTGPKGITATVVFLPDLARPVYFKAHSGLGHAKLEFALKDGALSSWGQESAAGVSEALESLASLVTAGAAVAKNLRELPLPEAEPGAPAFELYEIRMDESGTTLVPVGLASPPAKR